VAVTSLSSTTARAPSCLLIGVLHLSRRRAAPWLPPSARGPDSGVDSFVRASAAELTDLLHHAGMGLGNGRLAGATPVKRFVRGGATSCRAPLHSLPSPLMRPGVLRGSVRPADRIAPPGRSHDDHIDRAVRTITSIGAQVAAPDAPARSSVRWDLLWLPPTLGQHTFATQPPILVQYLPAGAGRLGGLETAFRPPGSASRGNARHVDGDHLPLSAPSAMRSIMSALLTSHS
jgi:hypothetical protein